MIGTGGASFTRNCAACSAAHPLEPPPWSERVFYQYGALRLTAVNATLLQLDWVCVAAPTRRARWRSAQADVPPHGGGGGGGGGRGGWGLGGAVLAA